MTLSVDDLAGMRSTLTDSLPDTCALIIDATTSDGHGGQTTAPTSDGATSLTSRVIGLGSKAFTTQAGLSYKAGESRIRATSAANPTVDYMEGVVASYSGTTLTLTIDVISGSGTHGDWSLIVPRVACRISPRLATGTGQLKDAETIEGERLIAQAPWMVTLPYGAAVDATNRIRSIGDGREFEVFAVLDPRSWSLDTRILCRLINDGAG